MTDNDDKNDMTEQPETEDMPAMAYFAGTALLLAVTMADSEPTVRLEKAVQKLIDLTATASGATKTLLDHTLATIRDHGMQFYMPGNEPQLEDVLHQIHRGHQELVASVQAGSITDEEFKAFAEIVRQVALAAVFINAESEPTQEQNEVLNYLYRVTQGEV